MGVHLGLLTNGVTVLLLVRPVKLKLSLGRLTLGLARLLVFQTTLCQLASARRNSFTKARTARTTRSRTNFGSCSSRNKAACCATSSRSTRATWHSTSLRSTSLHVG